MKRSIVFLIFCCPLLLLSQTGTFSVALTTTGSSVYDTPGAFMSIHGTIYNLSSTDSAELSIEKYFVDIPATWETALCTDICYPAAVNYIELTIPPADSQEFVFYFYTDLVADSGYCQVLYSNLNVPGNTVLHGYSGITGSPVGVEENQSAAFTVYPNPSSEQIFLQSNLHFSNEPYEIADLSGRVILKGTLNENEMSISVSGLEKGAYILRTGSLNLTSIKFLKQ